mgnify:CR=1 FL=1
MIKEYEELKAKILRDNTIERNRCKSLVKYKFEVIQGKTKQELLIGRPINLEDVLMALKSDYYINEDGYFYSIISENEDCGIYLEMVSPGIHWLLGKTLDQQTDETIRELNKIIN